MKRGLNTGLNLAVVYIVEKSVANKLHLAIKVNDPSPITTEMVMKVCLVMLMMKN